MKPLSPHYRRTAFLHIFLAVLILVCRPEIGRSAPPQALHGHVPAAAAQLTPRGFLDRTKRLKLAVGLPPRNEDALNQLLKELYDPASPNFHKYLTPAQFTEKFGASEADCQAVAAFAKAHHLTVTATHANRLIVDVEGAVADIEDALHIRLRTYQHPTEKREFHAPDTEPTLDLATPLLQISGLDDYSLPHPNLIQKQANVGGMVQANAAATAVPNQGSAPSGSYAGGDFRAAYLPGTTLTGAGQSVGLLQFDGFYPADIASYTARFGLPTIPIIVVPIDGGVTTPGSNSSEVSLDIEMASSMAPGLSAIYVYEAPNPSPWIDLLSRMANDNLAKQLSSSWTGGGPDATAEIIFHQMAAQGQSFFNASGDSDAYVGAIPFPADSPSITEVGGTTLTTSGAGGSYVSETVWNQGSGTGSSGGVSPTYPLPWWQANLNTPAGQTSSTYRNVPDVAFTGDNVYVIYGNGSQGIFEGTSCAAPLWAGFAALVNQQATANGAPTLGFLNPAIYTLEQYFNDIVTGNNYSPSSRTHYAAATGFDLCTGLGTPGNALISALNAVLLSPGTAPSSLTYSANPIFYATGVAIFPNVPSYLGGRVLSYSISPALPAGLALDPVTGVISGTPTVASPATNYTITAANNQGSTSVMLNIGTGPVTAQVYVLQSISTAGAVGLVGVYDASNGAAINSRLITGLNQPQGLAVLGNTLYVAIPSQNTICTYNATTGALLNASFVTGLNNPIALAISSNKLFVANSSGGTVGEYDAGTGAAINTSFISGLNQPTALLISGNDLFVTNSTKSRTVGRYNATTGAAINTSFITGSTGQTSLAICGSNLLMSLSSGKVYQYNATTGAAINLTFISDGNTTTALATLGNSLYVGHYTANGINAVGLYNGTTGAPSNANFIPDLQNTRSVSILATAPSNLSYPNNPAQYALGAPITPNIPSIAGGLVTYSISPPLPAGLSLDPASGAITGTPTATSPTTSYTVTATNNGGSASTSLTITVAAAPSNLTYSTNPAVYVLGTAIGSNVPTISGTSPMSYAVSPALPAGLVLNSTTGVITGTPSSVTPSGTYTLTATNSVGSTSAMVNITVNDVPPSALSYSVNPGIYVEGMPIQTDSPANAGGVVVTYSVASALPAGLSLDPQAGTITGTPTVLASAQNYTVTATNSGGSTTATVNLAVVSPLDYWRQQYFGTTSNTGNAGDSADPYQSGVSNLLAFAFLGPNQNPAQASLNQLPQLQIAGGNAFFSFTQPAGVSGVTYGAESSTDLSTGTWNPIPDTGTGSVHIFSLPAGGTAQLYMRLKVTAF